MEKESDVRKAGGSGPESFLFLSEILGRPVISDSGARAGTLADLKIKLGELYPKAVSLAVKTRRGRGLSEIPWANVQSFTHDGVHLKPEARPPFPPLDVGPDEVMLREELLDKQVVDTFGAKIERVNDIHLLVVHQDLRVVHVDYGIRGLLRRLGWLRRIDAVFAWLFAYRFEEKMVSWKYVQPLLSDPVKRNLKLNVAARKIHELHPSDLADIIEELDRINRSSLFRALDLQTAAQTLEEVEDPKLQASLIKSAPDERASDILEEMAPDEATDLLADLPREEKERLIQRMEKPSRDVVEELLTYEEGTAGSIMTKDYFSVAKLKTVGEAIEEFRRTTYPLESVAYIYLTAEDGRLSGVVTLRHLIICDRSTPLEKLMNPRLITVPPEERIREVSELFLKYKFLALPVVSEDGRQRGIITFKDIVQTTRKE
jgi:magnesium transporter